MLPVVRDCGPINERYGQVIFQLGEISRLEGQETQAETYYWKAWPLLAQSVGSEHLRMADALAELASLIGAVEKVRQRRSRPLVVLTYSVYVPRAKSLRPCWTGLFEQPLFLPDT
jgi:hypothetical protein